MHVWFYFRRSIAIIEEEIDSLISEQDFFGKKEQCNTILSLIADDELKNQINLQFTKNQSSLQRWNVLKAVVENYKKRVNIYKLLIFV